MLESPARAECPALEHHGLASKASKFPSQRHEWSKAVAGTFTQGSTARQSKCCSTQPAGVCSLCPTQHMPAQRVAAPCWTLQRQLSAAEAASMQECKQEKQRIVQKCCEIRMWDFSFSTHLQTGSRVLMALIASSTFPLGFLTVTYEHHIYHQY